jgi:Rod binding domain-containing protein
MDTSPIHPRIDASDIAPERLANNRQLTEEQKIGEVSRQFEAILLRQILQNGQKTVIKSSFADNSTTAGIYHDLVTHQLADSISKSGTMGLAKSLNHELTRQLHPVSMAGPDGKPEAQPAAPAVTPAAPTSTGPAGRRTHPLHLSLSKPGTNAPNAHE